MSDFDTPLPTQQTTTTSSSARPNYLGTDVGYRTVPGGNNGRQGMPATIKPVSATYIDGDQWSVWGQMSPAQRAEIQQALKDAGYIDRYVPGALDNSIASAMSEVMKQANATGQTWQETLRGNLTAKITTGPTSGGGGGGGRAAARQPLVFQLSNPDNVTAVAQKVAQDLLGRRLAAPEAKAFVDSFQQAERDYQTAAYGVTAASPDGTTVTETPDVAVAADKMIRDTNPTEVEATGIANTFSTFTSLLDGRL